MVSGRIWNNWHFTYPNQVIESGSFAQMMKCFLCSSGSMITGFVEPRWRFCRAICTIDLGSVEWHFQIPLPMTTKYQKWTECKKHSMIVYWVMSEQCQESVNVLLTGSKYSLLNPKGSSLDARIKTNPQSLSHVRFVATQVICYVSCHPPHMQ
jgi:hypothetical protein